MMIGCDSPTIRTSVYGADFPLRIGGVEARDGDVMVMEVCHREANCRDWKQGTGHAHAVRVERRDGTVIDISRGD